MCAILSCPLVSLSPVCSTSAHFPVCCPSLASVEWSRRTLWSFVDEQLGDYSLYALITVVIVWLLLLVCVCRRWRRRRVLVVTQQVNTHTHTHTHKREREREIPLLVAHIPAFSLCHRARNLLMVGSVVPSVLTFVVSSTSLPCSLLALALLLLRILVLLLLVIRFFFSYYCYYSYRYLLSLSRFISSSFFLGYSQNRLSLHPRKPPTETEQMTGQRR